MTTIAIKDGVMACDSQVTTGTMISQFKFDKVILHNDTYYGFAGSCHNIQIVQSYIKGDLELGDIPDSVNVTYLCMPAKGPAYQRHLHKNFITLMKLPSFYAIGSGADYAMVAMSCGKSAVEAVKEAIKWDCFSGGKVKAYSFNNVKKPRKAPRALNLLDIEWEK